MSRPTHAAVSQVEPLPTLALPAELTIYTVGELHPQWLAWLSAWAAGPAADAAAQADGAAVDEVDGAGLQLLLALDGALARQGRRLHIQAPSTVLQSGCAALGLQDWLQAISAPSVAEPA